MKIKIQKKIKLMFQSPPKYIQPLQNVKASYGPASREHSVAFLGAKERLRTLFYTDMLFYEFLMGWFRIVV